MKKLSIAVVIALTALAGIAGATAGSASTDQAVAPCCKQAI